MEEYPQHRENSAGIGSARRPMKRPRTEITRDDSPGTGPSSSTAADNTFPGLANSSNTVTVPGSILLPNRDSEGRRTIIDLTADDSPPRRQPEIIDVDALPDRPSSYFFDGNPTSSDDDGYRLLMARRRHPRPSGLAPPARPVEPSLNQHFNNRQYLSRYHQDITNPILGHGARSVNELGSPRHMDPVGESPVGRPDLFRLLGNLGNMFPTGFPTGFGFSIHGRGTIQMNDIGFNPPGQLDYRLGVNGIVHETPPQEDPVRRREAEYKAPPPAKDGFTRSPMSNDCLVCPSCEHELGTHSDEECQATVWLGKCGHVYCGKCATMFRSLAPRAKKQRGGHSGYCEVEGCHTNLRGRNLWEIFL